MTEQRDREADVFLDVFLCVFRNAAGDGAENRNSDGLHLRLRRGHRAIAGIIENAIFAQLGDVPLHRGLRRSDAIRDFLHGWRDTGFVREVAHELLDSCHKGLVFASHAKFLLNETCVSLTT